MSHTTLAAEEVTVPAVTAVQADCMAGSGPAEIGAVMRAAFPRVGAYLQAHGLECTGAPRAIYTTFTGSETRFTLAMPCAPPPAPVPEADGVAVRELPARSVLRFTHRGPYQELGATYGEITRWLIAHDYLENEAGWTRFAGMWEEYVSDPDVVPPAELVTLIYLPLD
ncbi:MAG: GyrI-like domain-containing protein [Gemmatimonadetes bacterium]|nr:GyrI-like domain-containing protein [Gemmatimonadota bacterium]